jgi:uncharacterized repeat protein (TIGR01451 family)
MLKIKRLIDMKKGLSQQIYQLFFNNRRFLSLFWAKSGCIFVVHSAVKQKDVELMKLRPANKMTLARVIFCAAILFQTMAGGLKAQGWQLNYGAVKTDEGWAVLQTEDEGYLVVGFGESFGTDNDQDIFVVRTDVDGRVVWSKYFDEGFREQARAIIPTADGNYLIAGTRVAKFGDNENLYLLKIDRKGNLIWSKTFGGPGNERAADVVQDPDGGYTITGTIKANSNAQEDILVAKFDDKGNGQWIKNLGTPRNDEGNAIIRFAQGYALVGNSKNETGFDNDIVLYRLNNNAEILWQRRLANSFREDGRAIIATKDGGIAIAGVINDNTDAFVAKFDANGNQRWARAVGQPGLEEEANSLAELNDGSLVLTGLKVTNAANVDVFLAKLDASGNILWEKTIGDPELTEEGRDIQVTSKGGYIITGYNGQLLSSFNDLILVKTDGAGRTISNRLYGQVFNDRDDQCDFDNGEPGLEGWVVSATKGNRVFYGTTDKAGKFSILVDTGAYNLKVQTPNRYWAMCSAEGVNVRFREFYDSVKVDFPAKTGVRCPYMEVDITTPFLAACSEISYDVNYWNTGTSNAAGAQVTLRLDPTLTYQSASIPGSLQADGTYRFNLGNVLAGQKGSFKVKAAMACSGIANGQSALVSAQVSPDTFCLGLDPRWDQSSVVVRGECRKDTVIFEIQNVGKGNMKDRKKGIIVADDVVLRGETPQYQLQSKQSLYIRIPNPDARTLRLFAEQSTGHPGQSVPTVAVEGCGPAGVPIKTGQVTQFPENDQDPFVSLDIQEIQSAVLPVALRGHPKGYRNSVIDAKTDLTFTVTFQNTGTDTIRRVVVRDTLSRFLDPASVIPGASNFPYTFEVYEDGTVRITFDDISLLPAKGSTAQNTYGFVEFRVSQKPNNANGTVIENRATVYFDYRKPTGTNTLRYRVDKFPDFLVITSNKEVFVKGVSVDVFPNPFSEMVTLEIKGRQYKKVQMSIFDLSGRLVQTQSFDSNTIYVYRNQLAAGLYSYKLESEGQLINTGKLVIR